MNQPSILTKEQRLKIFTTDIRARERLLIAFTFNLLQNLGLKPSNEDVEDVISDAYLTAAAKLMEDDQLHVENPYPWFRRFVYFEALGQQKKYLPLLNEFQGEVELLEDIRQGRGEDKTLLGELMSNLDDKERQIVLQSAEGYTSKAIAEKMNLSPANVRKIKSRVLATFREQLRNVGHD